MRSDISLERGWKSFGFAGPIALLLVFWASNARGVFDWSVFGLSFGALALCWARTWVLVPIHEVIAERDKAEWDRYTKNDWLLLGLLADLNGAEIDDLRTLVGNADNTEVRSVLNEKAPMWSDEERRRFLEYFISDISDITSVYIDSQGMIRTAD